MNEAPAGWYADVNAIGSERLWDGSAWTEHTRPAPNPPPPSANLQQSNFRQPNFTFFGNYRNNVFTAWRIPGIVVWGFYLSVVGFCGITAVVGLILSILGRKTAATAGRGLGLNTAAIIISTLWLLFFVALQFSQVFQN